MNKKITGSALAALLIAGTTSFSAFAAIPNFTAVVGNKAFDLEYINLNATEADNNVIREHIVAGKEIYVKMLDGSWVANSDNSAIDKNVLPEVTYKDKNGAETKYAAKDGDQVTGEVDKLEVESVEALNLKQIKVTFNGTPNAEAKKLSNYKLGKYTLTNEFKAADAVKNDSLTVDGNSVILTLNDAKVVKNQTTETLTISDKVAGTKVEEAIKFNDTTLPEVNEIEVIGNREVKLFFSEPVKTGKDAKLNDTVEVRNEDGRKISISGVEYQNNNTEAIVSLSSTIKGEKVTVQLHKGIEDYAGFNVITSKEEVAVNKITTAPTVVNVTATNTKVTLEFSQDVKANGSLKVADFYHTNSNNPAKTVTFDGKKVTLEFDEKNAIPAGTAYIFVKEEALVDYWGNKSEYVKVKVENEEDVKAPEVSEVKQVKGSQSKIEVKFTEKVNKDSAENYKNYKLLDKDGKEIEIKKGAIAIGEKNDSVIIDTRKSLMGTYTLEVSAVKDIAGNSLAKEVAEVEMKDSAAPSLAKTVVETYNIGGEGNQRIVINFKDINGDADTMLTGEDRYSIETLDNYAISYGYKDSKGAVQTATKQLREIKDKIEFSTIKDDTAVEIVINSSDIELTTVSAVEISRVKDAADNQTAELSHKITNFDNNKSIKVTSKAIDNQTIEVVIADVVEFVESDLTLEAKNNVTTGSTLTIDKIFTVNDVRYDADGNTIVTYKSDYEDAKLVGTFNNGDVTVKVKANPQTENEFGAKIATTDIAVADKIKAAIAKVETDKAKEVVVTFTEDINPETINKYTVKVGNKGIKSAVAVGNKVTITLVDDAKVEEYDMVKFDKVVDARNNATTELEKEIKF